MVFVVGIAGASCSGKSFLAEKIHKWLKKRHQLSVVLSQDRYYKNDLTNFDVPEAIAWDELEKDLLDLKNGKSVSVPVYDFGTHKRLPKMRLIEAQPVIILEGIFVLHQPNIRKLCNITIFVDADSSLRFYRRMTRDKSVRKRTEEDIYRQYTEQVNPAYKLYIKPSRQHANMIILNNRPKDYFIGLEILTGYLHARIGC